MTTWRLDLGASCCSDGSVNFKVWAPRQHSLQVKVLGKDRLYSMEKDAFGYFHAQIPDVKEKDLYVYKLAEGKERADPVSRFLPDGPFGPSSIIDPRAFTWTDQKWKGIAQKKLIFYECHVGTFTKEGTFQALLNKLPYLKDLGITCLEIMPIAQFSGKWNWGYDGVSLFAPHNAYGAPEDLKKLIDSCHRLGIAVCLDVVYNHFGPEGCFIEEFAPYMTTRYQSPWGKAVNLDGEYSNEVRHFLIQNALYWIHEYHIDALRLDALHALYDFSVFPFLNQLSQLVQKASIALGRKIHLIAESDLNDSRLLRPNKSGGNSLSAIWNEDFHHAAHVSLTKETQGYYQDYDGMKDLKKAMASGVVYEGEYSSYRKRSQGNSFKGIKPEQLVVFLQNHDQIGNRPRGDRLAQRLSFQMQKMSAMLLLLSPYLPLLFMGQEYGEEAPFEFFVDYQDKDLLSKVIEGRKKEFSQEEGNIGLPNESAFKRSKLGWKMNSPLLALYRKLIHLRKIDPAKIKVYSIKDGLAWESGHYGVLCDFGKEKREIALPYKKKAKLLLHTEQEEYAGNNGIALDQKRQVLMTPGECGALFRI